MRWPGERRPTLAGLRTAVREGGDHFLRRRLLELVVVDWLMLEQQLTATAPREPPEGLRLTTYDDPLAPPDLIPLAGRLDRHVVTARLAAGHVCFAVLAGDRPLAAVWARPDAVWLPFLRRLVPLERGDVYLYDSYTHPAERRRGLTSLRRRYSHGELHKRGYGRAVAYVMARNRAGLAAALGAGYVVGERHRWLHAGPVGLDLTTASGTTRLRLQGRGSDSEGALPTGRGIGLR